jgi:ankyrin
MAVSSFVQAIIDNNIGKVESLIKRYKKKENTKAFPKKYNVLTTRVGYRYDYPLHIAARYGHIDIIKLLVNQGAPIDQRNKHGHTPLIVALSNHSDFDSTIRVTNTVKTLLDLGCSLQDDNLNATPLHWATYQALEQVTKLLIEKDKSAMYSMNNTGNTPVNIAIGYGQKRIMDIYYYTDPNIVNTNNTLLHTAIANKRIEMIKYLFRLGMPISYLERKGKYGRTPLRLALNYPICAEIISLLLALGADAKPNTRHKYGSHTEDEVAAIRYGCFFSRSLVNRLLPFCMKS